MPQTPKAAASTRSHRKSSPPDAVQLLTQDHRKVALLFQQLAGANPTRKAEIAPEIFKELNVHASLEEELFYPALRSKGYDAEFGSGQGDMEINGANIADEDEPVDAMDENEGDEDPEDDDAGEGTVDQVIDDAYEDHQTVKALIGMLQGLDSRAPEFATGMDELKDLVLEHMAEEEEVLFAEARSKLDTENLGQQILERKQDLMSSVLS